MFAKRLLQTTLCVSLLSFIAPSTNAARIYQLVNYPDLQNGHTLSGTITATDDAPDDGMLDLAEILDWEWEVSDGFEVTVGQMHPTELHSESVTESLGIEIDSQGVYFSLDRGRSFQLRSNTNLNSRGFNIHRLAWFIGDPDTPPQYAFFGVRSGDISFQAWDSHLPSNPDRWVIATRVPEPSGMVLSCCVVICALFLLRVWQK